MKESLRARPSTHRLWNGRVLLVFAATVAALAGVMDLGLSVGSRTLRVHLLDLSVSHGKPGELLEALSIRSGVMTPRGEREAVVAFAADAWVLVAPTSAADVDSALRGAGVRTRVSSLPREFVAATNFASALALARTLGADGEHLELVLHGDGRHADPELPPAVAFTHAGALPQLSPPSWRMHVDGAPPLLREGASAVFHLRVACDAVQVEAARVLGPGVDLPCTLVDGEADLLITTAPLASTLELQLVNAAGHALAEPLRLPIEPAPSALRVAVLAHNEALQAAFPSSCTLADAPRVICIGSMPAESLGDDLATVKHLVEREGTGLVLIGGPSSFAAGGFEASALEGLSPLSSHPAGPREIIVALDASGSMDTDGRWLRAIEAAQSLARQLHPDDRMQVVPFASGVEEPQPAAPASGERLQAALKILKQRTPGGGTRIAPLLAWMNAHPVGPNAHRRTLLLSDCAFADSAVLDSPEVGLRDWRLRAGDLTTLLLDPTAETLPIAKKLGDSVEPCHKVVPELLLSHLRRDAWRVGDEDVRGSGAGLEDVQFTGLGVNATRVAPGAQVLARSKDGAPLLALRQAGQGRVLACATTGQGGAFEDALRKFARLVAREPRPPARFTQSVSGLRAEFAATTAIDGYSLRDAQGVVHSLRPTAHGDFSGGMAVAAGPAAVLNGLGEVLARGEVPARTHLEWVHPTRKLASRPSNVASGETWPWALLVVACIALALGWHWRLGLRKGRVGRR